MIDDPQNSDPVTISAEPGEALKYGRPGVYSFTVPAGTCRVEISPSGGGGGGGVLPNEMRRPGYSITLEVGKRGEP